ncbi:MAG: MmcQ/YjbR family DNA-binding protein [Actinomycetota bacterium]
MTFDEAREVALAFPGMEEGPCYGPPAFRVRGKLLGRLREDGDSLVVKTDIAEREALLGSDPDVFYITDHYRAYPMVLMRLSRVEPEVLRELLEDAWRQSAAKRVVAAYDQGRG